VNKTEETITDFDVPIQAGLYRLLVAFPDMPYEKERIGPSNVTQARGYKETRSFSTQTTHSSIGVGVNLDDLKIMDPVVKNREIPVELEEMQASIEAMLFVIGTIPDR
jgi:hypothetical protein